MSTSVSVTKIVAVSAGELLALLCGPSPGFMLGRFWGDHFMFDSWFVHGGASSTLHAVDVFWDRHSVGEVLRLVH